jgi:hypothetical protein
VELDGDFFLEVELFGFGVSVSSSSDFAFAGVFFGCGLGLCFFRGVAVGVGDFSSLR